MDLYYAAQIQTAAERIRPLLTKGRINKDDIDGLIELMSDLLAIKTQLKGEGMEGDLDWQDRQDLTPRSFCETAQKS